MISVGIVTQGRPDLFRRALEALARASHDHEIEFIFLINGPDSRAESIARLFSETHEARVFIRTSQLSPGDARNFLISQSRGEWIYFADDDAEVAPGIFDRFVESRRRNREASVFGGPNLTPENSTGFQRACGLALASSLGSFRCADRYRKTKLVVGCDDSKLILCNLFVRTALARTRLFPSDFVCAEENEALSQWRRGGAVLVYDPELIVYHERRKTWSGFASQILKYGRGRGRLISRADFHWFHLVPGLALIGALFAPIPFLGLCISVYLGLLLVTASLNTNRRDEGLRMILAIATIHGSYALGTLIGAFIDAPLSTPFLRKLSRQADIS